MAHLLEAFTVVICLLDGFDSHLNKWFFVSYYFADSLNKSFTYLFDEVGYTAFIAIHHALTTVGIFTE